jgi:hypothetical protein
LVILYLSFLSLIVTYPHNTSLEIGGEPTSDPIEFADTRNLEPLQQQLQKLDALASYNSPSDLGNKTMLFENSIRLGRLFPSRQIGSHTQIAAHSILRDIFRISITIK